MATALDDFKTFTVNMSKSSVFQSWAKAHSTENQRWLSFSAQIINGKKPTAPTMTTAFGKALVQVGEIVLKIGVPTTGYGVGTYGEAEYGA